MKMPTPTTRNVKPDAHAFQQKKVKHQVTGKDLFHRIRSKALAIGGADDLAEAIEGTKRP